jgi:hypothetical protein
MSNLNCEEVLFIDSSEGYSITRGQLDLACRFCGLSVKRLFTEGKDCRLSINALELNDFQAVVITGQALMTLNMQHFIDAFKRKDGKRPPLLIAGITPDVDASILSMLSGGAVVECKSSVQTVFNGFYRVANKKSFARQLAGFDIPFAGKGAIYFVLDGTHGAEPVVQLVNQNESLIFPIFAKTMLNGQDVFFLAQSASTVSIKSVEGLSSRFVRGRFFEISPLIMFLRYACKERCWHSPGYYANLTIDDPWLSEPYGFLSYKELIEEMEKADFHTTVAFVPWNYNRSKKEVVSLFHKHPDRFSICIHGNNHDHHEFYKYKNEPTDYWPAKPLSVQETNIKQALARMAEFSRLTGLAYEHVMVFPNRIAPAKTLALLKKYNFLGTVNGRNVPLDCKAPQKPLFHLRPFTLDFENFVSLKRSKVKRFFPAKVVTDLFLDYPVLLYEHHGFFRKGPDSFNKIAEMINSIEPSIKWRSLGYIARHLYLQRMRHDGDYDILAFCRMLEIENKQSRDMTYFIRKEESFFPTIKQVTIDGEPCSYERVGSDLSLVINIPAGQSRLIDIEYENDLDLAAIDISKNDNRVNRLRRLSDFRDLTLSKNILGRAFTMIYYQHGLYKTGLKSLLIAPFRLIAAMCSAGRLYFLKLRKNNISHKRNEALKRHNI